MFSTSTSSTRKATSRSACRTASDSCSGEASRSLPTDLVDGLVAEACQRGLGEGAVAKPGAVGGRASRARGPPRATGARPPWEGALPPGGRVGVRSSCARLLSWESDEREDGDGSGALGCGSLEAGEALLELAELDELGRGGHERDEDPGAGDAVVERRGCPRPRPRGCGAGPGRSRAPPARRPPPRSAHACGAGRRAAGPRRPPPRGPGSARSSRARPASAAPGRVGRC